MNTSNLGYSRGELPVAACESIKRIDSLYGVLPITEAGRSYDRQLYLYNQWVNRVPGFNRALHPDNPLARHVLLPGRSGAIDTEAVRTGFISEQEMNDHGWYRTAPDEYWHYEYFIDKDNYVNGTGDIVDKIDRLAAVVGGTYERSQNGESISQRLDYAIDLIERLAVVVGGTYDRAKNGESISQRLDKVLRALEK